MCLDSVLRGIKRPSELHLWNHFRNLTKKDLCVTDTSSFFQKPFNSVHDMYCLIIDCNITGFVHTY